jgi:hypothetical protein
LIFRINKSQLSELIDIFDEQIRISLDFFFLHILDATPAASSTKNFYLVHHQSSLVPINNFLNQNLNHSNIELIQMDEQECILEIVDGVVTLVPKDKSISLNSDEEKSEEEEEKNSIEDQINHNDGKKRRRRKKTLGEN